MATNIECDCISIVADLLNESSTLNMASIIAIHHGNLKYKKNVTLVPISFKGIYDDIASATKKLVDKAPEFNKGCGTLYIPEEQDRFNKATGKLENIAKKGKELKEDDVRSAFYSSITINDVLSRAIKRHKLIHCR